MEKAWMFDLGDRDAVGLRQKGLHRTRPTDMEGRHRNRDYKQKKKITHYHTLSLSPYREGVSDGVQL